MKETDKLKELFFRQKEFDNYMCKVQGLDQDDPETKKLLLANCLTALQVEVSELQNEFSFFKHWKKNKPDSVTDEAKLEFIDCLCFLVSIGNKMFEDTDEVLKWYDEKMQLNFLRQENNY